MPWRAQSGDPTLWDGLRSLIEAGGPWGLLGGFALVGWRVIRDSYSAGNDMRAAVYADALARMETERAEYDADRARWSSERAQLMAELDALREQ